MKRRKATRLIMLKLLKEIYGKRLRLMAAKDIAFDLEQKAGLGTPNKGDPCSSDRGRILHALRVLYPDFNNQAQEFLTAARSQSRKAKNRTPKKESPNPDKISEFYNSFAWRKKRYAVIVKHGRACMACGAVDRTINVDHIKPIRLYWSLRLDDDNLQILCDECNHGKGNWDQTDWRQPENRGVSS